MRPCRQAPAATFSSRWPTAMWCAPAALLRGEPFLYPAAVTEIVRHYLDGPAEEHPDPLTPRELQVIKLIAEGHTNQQIAEALTISKKTVERHRANMLEKLGMRDRVELTRYAIRRGLIEP